MKNKKVIIIIAVLLIIALIITGLLVFKVFSKDENKEEQTEQKIGEKEEDKTLVIVQQEEKEEKKDINIFKGNDRPIAVMIDNHSGAWPQAALNDAYMVYEIIVEGGETRLMALFKGVDVENIGPVRSSRHYFLDYALENDAIYVHYGWSPKAKKDITSLNVNNINGITESASNFWRTNKKSAPHNVLTKTSNILSIAERKGYATTSNKASVLNYSSKEVNLENGEDAAIVTIPHSNLQTVRYEYDAETKRYTRYARNKLQTDFDSGEPVTTKNIIITMCDNHDLSDNESKGRQDLENIGTFNGYYITNGKAIQIKCTKTSRTEQTIYKTLDGKVIDVNDGNTFINICPTDANIVIEAQ